VPQLRLLEDDKCSIIVDERYPSLVIAKFTGITTEKLLREYFTWYRGCLSSLRPTDKFVLIADTREVFDSSSIVRKVAAEEMSKLPGLMREHCLQSIIIVDSAAMRGILTAIGWLTRMSNMTVAKDLSEAFALTSGILSRAGLEMPRGLEAASYRVPVPGLQNGA
jgi:hypothetical protein